MVGWGPWQRRQKVGGRRRRNLGRICAAPSYAAIITSWKTSSVQPGRCSPSKVVESLKHRELLKTERRLVREFDQKNFLLVQKPDVKRSGAFMCQLVASKTALK